jgi:hypothetical protein
MNFGSSIPDLYGLGGGKIRTTIAPGRAVPDPAQASPFAARILPLASGASPAVAVPDELRTSISAEGVGGGKTPLYDSLGVRHGQILGNSKKN